MDEGKFQVVEYITFGEDNGPATAKDVQAWEAFGTHEFMTVGIDYDRILKREILPDPGIPGGAIIDKNFKWHSWQGHINWQNEAWWEDLLTIL